MPNTLAQNAQIINEAVADIKDEIALKGVTVPDPCPITTIPSLIESISGGGGEQDTQQLINLIEDDENFSLVIPDGCTKIGHEAFYDNDKLTSVVIPEGVTTIGYNAFFNCTSLASVVIPEGVTTIGYNAFRNCTSLASVEIPAGVTTIGSSTFRGCTSLANVDLTKFTNPNAIPTLANSEAFSGNASGRKFIVANAEMKAAFSAATNWSSYASDFITAEEAAQNA